MNRNALAMPEHAQLLERLDLLQRAGRQGREAAQEARAVGIQAHMSQRLPGGSGAIAPPGDGCARKVQRPAGLVRHELDDIRVREFVRVGQRMRSGRHHAIGLRGQGCRTGVDHGRRDQWLVALHIDDHRVVRQAQLPDGFGEAVAAGRMVGPRLECVHAVRGTGGDDLGRVRRDDDLARFRRGGTACHVDDHRQPGEVGQRLVGQSGRCQPRRDDDREAHPRVIRSARAEPVRWPCPGPRAGPRFPASRGCRRGSGRPVGQRGRPGPADRARCRAAASTAPCTAGRPASRSVVGPSGGKQALEVGIQRGRKAGAGQEV
mmetsp:Transcript_1399/g.4118  ORF Transcript_1399/g.4118 Transcript_1399/m.4118 type:complete len:319 (+) Transcript_1399:1493-2449(+)